MLRGDPDNVAAVADALEFDHKYTSGVIAWAPEDQPSDQDIDRVLDEFEQTAWAGLEPDRYAWAAVQHRVRTAEQNLSGFIPVNDAITTDPRQRHRRHQPDGRGVLVFLCRNVGNTWRGLMIRGHAWMNVKTMVSMSALLVAVACGDDDGPTAPTAPSPTPLMASSGSLQLSLNGLESLGAGFVYEGWLLVNGNPVSTGTFSVGADGSLSTSMFSVDQAALQAATKFILTIEPSPDSSPMPAATKYLAGDFVENNASLSVGDAATLGNDFKSASGGFILATPSTNAVADDYASGIWWLDPASHGAALTLPALPAGWMYEGWVVGPDGPVTTGRFTQATGADSDGGGPGAGPDGTPAFPGQEFITPPVSLIGYQAVISIEPEPDDSPGPFTLKPLVDMDIEDVRAMVLQDMANNASSFPTGMATR